MSLIPLLSIYYSISDKSLTISILTHYHSIFDILIKDKIIEILIKKKEILDFLIHLKIKRVFLLVSHHLHFSHLFFFFQIFIFQNNIIEYLQQHFILFYILIISQFFNRFIPFSIIRDFWKSKLINILKLSQYTHIINMN